MTSDELNDALMKLEMSDTLPYECFGGKPVPYIGWFWRDVDFDTETHWLGVIPAGVESNETNLVGFMENNKWGYPEIKVEREKWAEIKSLLEKALTSMKREDFARLNDTIQALADGQTFHVFDPYY